jgi:hypothetical protein
MSNEEINPTHPEGRIAKTIEHQTAKMPSDWFLLAAVGSIATSMMLQISGKHHAGTFIGQWAPTFLILGVYNKLVKQLGSDDASRAAGSSGRGSRFGQSTPDGTTCA